MHSMILPCVRGMASIRYTSFIAIGWNMYRMQMQPTPHSSENFRHT